MKQPNSARSRTTNTRGWRPQPGGLVLGAIHLAGSAAVSSSWLFGKYPNLAAGLAHDTLTAAQVGDASPAYLLLNVLLGPTALRWLQWLAAGLAVVLLFEVLSRLGGSIAAWLGGALLAASQGWLVYSAVLEPDLLIGALLVVALGLLALPARRGATLLAALALGLSVSLRPTTVLVAALVGGWHLWKARRREARGWLGPAAVLALSAIAPAVALEALAGHDVRGTMSAGQVFHQSHHPGSTGVNASFPTLLKLVEVQASNEPHPPDHAHTLYREVARAAGAGTVDVDAERYWGSLALTFLREQPAAAVRSALEKVVLFVTPHSVESDIPAVQGLLARTAGVPLRWLAVLGCGGLLVALRRRLGQCVPFGLHWLAALGLAVLFYSQGRYAVGLVPSLAALAGLGGASLVERGWRPAERLLAVGLLVLPAVGCLVPQVRWGDRIAERVVAAEKRAPPMADGADPWIAALDVYVERQAAMPDVFWPTAPFGAGVRADDVETARAAAERAEQRWGVAGPVDATLAAGLWAAAGRCDRALELLGPQVDSGFSWANCDAVIDPRVVASDCLLAGSKRAEAVAELELTNRRAPGRLEVLARLVAAADTGSATDVATWEAQLAAFHDPLSVHYALSHARRLWGDPQGAISDAEWVASHWAPAAPFAEVERALALASLGRDSEALDAWTRTLVLHAPVHGVSRLDLLVGALVQASPTPEVREAALRYFRLRGDRARVRALRGE